MTVTSEFHRPHVPHFLGVVIPARNEIDHIARAVRSVRLAMRHEAVRAIKSWIVVVDDGSTDRTAKTAGQFLGRDGEVVSGHFGTAGAARRAGLERLLKMAQQHGNAEDAWLASTDADSIVPPTWLDGHLQSWHQGIDAMAGMVTPIWDHNDDESLRSRYEEMMDRLGTGLDHPHVYGANLGFTAQAYVRAGKMPTIATGEDHSMWKAFRASGASMISVGDDPVATSPRRQGRATQGFASLLASLASD